MFKNPRIASVLPCPLPNKPIQRHVLTIIRRMVMNGHQDARACNFALHVFGRRFRQILALTRCTLHETALASGRRIQIASCCTPRMTRDEALFLDAIFTGDFAAMSAITDHDEPYRAMSAAACLKSALGEICPEAGR